MPCNVTSELVATVLVIYVILWVLSIIMLERNDFPFTLVIEEVFHILGLDFLREAILLLGKTFSSGKDRQKRELARFIRKSKEIERCLQRYQYFAEMNAALKWESSVHFQRGAEGSPVEDHERVREPSLENV